MKVIIAPQYEKGALLLKCAAVHPLMELISLFTFFFLTLQ